MPYGQLEVYVSHARGHDDYWLNDTNPFVVINCRSEEKKSNVASAERRGPEWNESMLFTVCHGCDEIHLKIMDDNTAEDNDFIAETIISLEEVFSEGEVRSTMYDLSKDDENCGSIKLGLTFRKESD